MTNLDLAEKYAEENNLRSYRSIKPEIVQIITNNSQKVTWDLIAITLYAKVTEKHDRVIVS